MLVSMKESIITDYCATNYSFIKNKYLFNNLPEQNFPSNFDYATTKDVDITISNLASNAVIIVYATFQNDKEELIARGKETNGVFSQTITLPTYCETIKVVKVENGYSSSKFYQLTSNSINVSFKTSFGKAGCSELLYAVNGQGGFYTIDNESGTYEETILPNLCYVGGGGELSYWLQLKSCFDAFNVPFPLLLHRSSAIIVTSKQHKKLQKGNISFEDLFLSSEELSTKIAKAQRDLINFSDQKQHLKQQFENLYRIAKQTDASFLGAVAAQEKKQLKGLSHLEKRLLKAEKQKHKAQIEQALLLQSALFPNGNLQERVLNFSTFYAIYGHDFIEKLKSDLNPFQQGFAIISL